jgi:hypothetical protein
MKLTTPIQLVLLLSLSFVLSGCPMTRYNIFIRNKSAEATQLILVNPGISNTKENSTVSYLNQVLPINKKTVGQLQMSLYATYQADSLILSIPPNSTVLINNLLKSQSYLQNNRVFIRSGKLLDTINFIYPYKKIKNVSHRRDISNTYTQKTLLFYDILPQ